MFKFGSRSLLVCVLLVAIGLSISIPFLKRNWAHQKLRELGVVVEIESGKTFLNFPAKAKVNRDVEEKLRYSLSAIKANSCKIEQGWNPENILLGFDDPSTLTEVEIVTCEKNFQLSSAPAMSSLVRLSIRGDSTEFFGLGNVSPSVIVLNNMKVNQFLNSGAAELKSVVMSNCVVDSNAVAQLATVSAISIVNCDVDLNDLSVLTSLQYCLVSIKKKNVSLEFLENQASLEELIVRRPVSLEPLHDLRQLRFLEVGCYSLNESDLHWIMELVSLESITFSDCEISPEALQTLKSLEQRRDVRLSVVSNE